MQVVLALDAGTTSVRALAVDPSGAILAVSQQEFTQFYPEPGLIEHDPEEIWLAAANTLKDVSQQVEEMGHDIVCIGITNQRETSIIWDQDSGKPLHNAIVWQDESLGAKFDIVEIPEDLKEQAKEYREKLIEKAVEEDDSVMESYLDGKEPSLEDLKKCIRKGTIKGSFVPVLTGSAFKNKGVQPLLDAVIDYMPSPIDVDNVKGSDVNDETKELTRSCSDSEPFSALAFKIMTDPFVGSLTFTRIYSGTIDTKDTVLNSYISNDDSIVRISTRVYESSESLNRDLLLKKINSDLQQRFGISSDKYKITGLAVLYNNMLQSLFSSMLNSIIIVYSVIALMLLILFRSVKIMLAGLLPNILIGLGVLGTMGLLKIPLDIMTITVASISVGIAVDNTIHYLYKFKSEYELNNDFNEAMIGSHSTIGRAIFYTASTISLGFLIFSFSNFIPTIYFGIFTALAMFFAFLVSLTLLPILLEKVRAFE